MKLKFSAIAVAFSVVALGQSAQAETVRTCTSELETVSVVPDGELRSFPVGGVLIVFKENVIPKEKDGKLLKTKILSIPNSLDAKLVSSALTMATSVLSNDNLELCVDTRDGVFVMAAVTKKK